MDLKVGIVFAGNQRLGILKEVNSQITPKLPRHEEQIEKIRRRVIEIRVRHEKQKETVERKRQQLKKVIRTAAKQLIQYIFPLSQVEPTKRLTFFLHSCLLS